MGKQITGRGDIICKILYNPISIILVLQHVFRLYNFISFCFCIYLSSESIVLGMKDTHQYCFTTFIQISKLFTSIKQANLFRSNNKYESTLIQWILLAYLYPPEPILFTTGDNTLLHQRLSYRFVNQKFE